MAKYVKYRLIKNYRQLIKFKKFKSKGVRRYYYVAIRRLIDLVRGKITYEPKVVTSETNQFISFMAYVSFAK